MADITCWEIRGGNKGLGGTKEEWGTRRQGDKEKGRQGIVPLLLVPLSPCLLVHYRFV